MTTIAQEYKELGRIENLQENILDLLDIRLGEVSEEIEEKITAVTDTTLLRQLHREAATAVSLPAFLEKLSTLTDNP